jgi:DNA adenine methylase
MGLFKTPLRYPGGKQRLAPFVAEVISANNLSGCHYVEPYAGGAGVAIELLLNGTVEVIHLNDSSYPVFAFWKSILSLTDLFCKKIVDTPLTISEWQKQKYILNNYHDFELLEIGFSMFYLNRCNRSGILNAGVIGGLAQSGEWKMDARFPKKELIARIETISAKKSKIKIRNLDAEKYIKEYIPELPKNSFVYFDPPYFNKAERLYLNRYEPQDHARIAKIIQNIGAKWMVSYDAAAEILSCYTNRRSFVYDLQYSAAKAYKGREVFFFSDKVRIPQNSAIAAIDKSIKKVKRNRKASFAIHV